MFFLFHPWLLSWICLQSYCIRCWSFARLSFRKSRSPEDFHRSVHDVEAGALTENFLFRCFFLLTSIKSACFNRVCIPCWLLALLFGAKVVAFGIIYTTGLTFPSQVLWLLNCTTLLFVVAISFWVPVLPVLNQIGSSFLVVWWTVGWKKLAPGPIWTTDLLFTRQAPVSYTHLTLPTKRIV